MEELMMLNDWIETEKGVLAKFRESGRKDTLALMVYDSLERKIKTLERREKNVEIARKEDIEFAYSCSFVRNVKSAWNKIRYITNANYCAILGVFKREKRKGQKEGIVKC